MNIKKVITTCMLIATTVGLTTACDSPEEKDNKKVESFLNTYYQNLSTQDTEAYTNLVSMLCNGAESKSEYITKIKNKAVNKNPPLFTVNKIYSVKKESHNNITVEYQMNKQDRSEYSKALVKSNLTAQLQDNDGKLCIFD